MRWTLAALLALACALSVAAVPAGAVHETGSSFTLFLHTDGSADVVLTQRYDLTNATRRAAFERLEANESARTTEREAFHARLVSAAERGTARTNRTMAIADPRIEVKRFENDTGQVVLSATWEVLLVVEPRADGFDYLEVSEPFASGFAPNHTLAIHGPEGFLRAGTAPDPAVARKNSAMWGATADLTGFQVRFAGSVGAGRGGEETPTATAVPATQTPRPPQGAGRFVGAVLLALIPALAVVGWLRLVEEG
jgi:hypothetical protein